MYDVNSLLEESRDALEKVWFLQSLEVRDRTDLTTPWRGVCIFGMTFLCRFFLVN